MAEGRGRSSGQGVKLLYIRDYLHKYTNKEHPKSAKEISAYLASKGIKADRKTIYNDILRLQIDFQEPIAYAHKKGYYIAKPEFTGTELAVLIDCIRFAPFMTKDDAFQLTSKVKSLSNIYDLPMLAQHSGEDTNKQDGCDSTLKNLQLLTKAIEQKRKVSFQRIRYVAEHSTHTEVEPEIYIASPFRLTWMNGRYILKCAIDHLPADELDDELDELFDDEFVECLKQKYGDDWEQHYAEILNDGDKIGTDEPVNIECDISLLSSVLITDFPSIYAHEKSTEPKREATDGTIRAITIRFRKSVLRQVAFDLGKDAVFIPVDKYHFKTTVRREIDYSLSDWIRNYGCYAKILSPQEAVDFLLAVQDDSMHELKTLYNHDLEPISMLEMDEYFDLTDEEYNILVSEDYPRVHSILTEDNHLTYEIRKNDQ